jgi:hypothetical protein
MSTPLLDAAFAKIKSLPEIQQEAIAELILEEIESENRWDQQFANSLDQLSLLADAALAEDESHQTKPLGDSLL